MGSSKKHKEKDREHKSKRRHRSRSSSRSREERRKEKKEKRRRRDESDEESPSRAGVSQGSPSRDQIEWDKKEQNSRSRPGASDEAATDNATGEDGAGAGLSLSIEETNKLRASLGLKPLDVTDEKKEDGRTADGDVHAPAVNMAEIKRTDDLKEKMLLIKEKRQINKALGKVKKLADDDSDDDSATAWVQRSRKIEADRQRAVQMEKMLEDMDNEFNLGSLVAEEFAEKKKTYGSKDLRGLRVEHAQESFVEGKTTILVLKDKDILQEEDAEDTLVNFNMLDDEHAARNIEAKKKKPDYKPYDEPEFDEYGMLKPKEVLDKYDEEIQGRKKESFELGGGGRYNAEHERRMQEIRSALRQQGESLVLPAPKIVSEYYTNDEMASFKKPKKKKIRTLRKKTVLKADDLLAISDQTDTADFGSRNRHALETRSHENPVSSSSVKVKTESMPDDMDIDETVGDSIIKVETKEELDNEDDDNLGPSEDLTGVTVDEDSAKRDLERVLNKTRRLRYADHGQEKRVKIERHDDVNDEEESLPFRGQEFETNGPEINSNIVMYSTSEFCRSLGDIPTYGQAGNRNRNDDDIMDYAPDYGSRVVDGEDDDDMGAWQSVEIDTKPVEIKSDEKPVLDDEPVLTGGLAGALLLASKKGYLENKAEKISSAASRKAAIEALNYSIEDKRYDDLDEKYSRKRDRYSTGVTMDFKEKEGYKPDVKIDYVDDQGKAIPPKEAFRLLSHRFHGKGSGKKKTEKRMKKAEEEQLMLTMNSTDTPLHTVHMLKERQKVEKTPYVILSGGKGMASSMLAK